MRRIKRVFGAWRDLGRPGEKVQGDLTKAEASTRIDELQERTGRG